MRYLVLPLILLACKDSTACNVKQETVSISDSPLAAAGGITRLNGLRADGWDCGTGVRYEGSGPTYPGSSSGYGGTRYTCLKCQ